MEKTIIYKPESAFEVVNGKIKQKKYSDDLVSLLSGSFDLSYSKWIKEPIVNSNSQILNGGPEAEMKKISVSGELSYHPRNFQPFKNGSLRFQVKTEHNKGYSYQGLLGINSLAEDLEDYAIGLVLSLDGANIYQDIIITLNNQGELSAQVADIASSLISAIEGMEPLTSFSNILTISSTETDVIFYTNFPNYVINLVPPMSTAGQSCIPLTSLFSGVSKTAYYNTPSEDITFLSLDGEEDYIRLIHKTDGNIWASFHGNQEIKLSPWNRNSREWTEYEISFSENLVSCYREGILVSANTVSGILREEPNVSLTLRGTAEDTYSFGQISIFSEIQHVKNYTPYKYIKPYSIENAYVEFHYGAIDLYNDRSISIDKDGDLLFALYNGALLVAGPMSADAFEQAFKNTEIDAYHDLIVKVEFPEDEAELKSITATNGTPTPSENTSNPVNFNNIFDFIRRSLGYPKVPVELTDDQLLDALNQSVFQYNRYRNYDKKLDLVNTSDLDRHPDGSYYLPVGIEEKDIIEILFKPRYSWSWYSGDNSLMANMYMQNLFSGYNLSQSAADYYINITTQNDLKNIFGSQSGWSINNGRLYLFPKFPGIESMRIGIKYRETISIEEINTNIQIRQLALAYAKITLGNIRSTFGNQIPGGDAMLQLNGADLIQQGQSERDMYIAEFIKQQPILQFLWT